MVEENPDAYLYWLAKPFGCTPQAIFSILKEMNITYKKTSHIPKNPRKNAASI